MKSDTQANPGSMTTGFHVDVTQTQERVVGLSNGPTNLKYDGVV
jgi:hypothetical protein